MTTEQLRAVAAATPFRPFMIYLADDRNYHVPHPEFLSQSPSGRTIIVYGPGEAFSILDLLLVAELQSHDRTSYDRRYECIAHRTRAKLRSGK